eukprot:Nitzschia sp. Nitz4//scaffold11_size288233//46089//48144//NITZ4_000739-RA/size288233-snap-gene-0.42-mRNA-1//-1//CDS//3329533969//8180//frame0
MAPKKRVAHRKRSRTTYEDEKNNDDVTSKKSPPTKKGSKLVSFQAHRQLWFGAIALSLAILVSLVFNRYTNSISDPIIRSFWTQICRDAQCASSVQPNGRSLVASRPVRRRDVLMEIPRSVQIWDIDALRSDFVKDNQLLLARHDRTNNPLSSAAFLAVHLVVLHQQHQNATSLDGEAADPSQRSYFSMLPTLEQLSDHPLFWQDSEARERLNIQSQNYATLATFQDMISSEYQAFSEASPHFATRISKEDYKLARVQVLTRSFSPGPVASSELEDTERDYYKQVLAVDFSNGCHVMVPILDMLNHHPNPNVAYSYNPSKQAFVVTSNEAIDTDGELYDSYGKFTDPHLFARFGFVNGDGSGYTQASIGLFHRLLNTSLDDEFSYLPRTTTNRMAMDVIRSSQRRDMSRYLQYDDGYAECIPGKENADPLEWRLKQLKLEHLVQIANDPSHWVVHVPPRNPSSRPALTLHHGVAETPPEFDMRTLRMNLTPLIDTCRLISLTREDLDGKAIEELEQNLGNPDYRVPMDTENVALEYRAFVCLSRLTTTSLLQYKNRRVNEELELVRTLNRESFGSRNWTTAHLRLGEMQTLQVISMATFGQTKKMEQEIPDPRPTAFAIRERPCQKEYLEGLF